METKTKIFIGIGIFVVIGIIIASFLLGGSQGFFSLIGIIFKVLFWLLVVGAVFAVVYFLFLYEKKINARLEVYKDIVRETKINKVRNLQNLYSAGDTEHPPIMYGKITGYSQRQNYDAYAYKDEKGKEQQVFYYFNESIFRVKRTFDNPLIDFFASVFVKRIVIRCPTQMHDRLQGDVYMNCSTLVRHGNYFYPNNLHLNFEAIDKTIFNESMRYINMDIVRLAHPLIMKGMGVTRLDRKELEGIRGWDYISGRASGQKPQQMGQ